MLIAEEKPLGEMEYWRALQQAHGGAVYLHRGKTYVVDSLDLDRKLARLVRDEPTYYTTVLVQSLVEKALSLESDAHAQLCGVKVTTTIPSFFKWGFGKRELLGETPLELPAQTIDTVGFRLDFPDLTFEEAGTVHAMEHALLALAPLIAGCDRSDIGSCWFAMSPDTMMPALYIYDQVPGGVGLAEKLYSERTNWWKLALSLLDSCKCLEGCPSCLWNTQCTNKSLDKQGALVYLWSLLGIGHPPARHGQVLN